MSELIIIDEVPPETEGPVLATILKQIEQLKLKVAPTIEVNGEDCFIEKLSHEQSIRLQEDLESLPSAVEPKAERFYHKTNVMPPQGRWS